jgi:hypothetical protein
MDNGAEMGIATDIPYDLNGYDEYGIFRTFIHLPSNMQIN